MINYFDLQDVSDLPDEIKNGLNDDCFSNQILELFDIAQRDLSVDEVTVAYFRKFGEPKTKKQIMSKLYNMSRIANPKIVSVKKQKGVYRRKGE